jgi:MoaA/NifB/PqqE/SkfB family radical SAM enzyme
MFAHRVCSYVDEFVIAVHGPNAWVHDSITRKGGSFHQTIRGISNLLLCGTTKITGKIVISKYNLTCLPDAVRLLHSVGIRRFVLAFPHARGNARTFFYYIVPRYAEVRPFVEEVIRYSEAFGLHTTFEAILPCALTLSLQGAELFSDFNEAELAVKEIKQLHMAPQDWNRLRRSIKRKGGICGVCKYDPVCEGYWYEYVDAYGFDEFKPIL